MDKMNYNHFSMPKEYSNLPINSRAKLDTGTQCNYKCDFCYYINDLDKVTDFEEIKQRIDIIKNMGIKEIDLSGGESTIHKDWFSILDYCNERFNHISCLSNGSRLKDYDFVEKSYSHGLREVLFSLHGWDEESHDRIVGHNKAFRHIIQAIHNCEIIGIKVRLNCTVTSQNVEHMKKYAELVNKLKPAQINFLPLNYWSDAKDQEPEKYEDLACGIKKAINMIDSSIEINVRYIPFCFMKGYEKYVVGTYQHIFDLGDWNILAYDYKLVSSDTVKDYYEAAFRKRNYTYTKPRECFECKHFLICDGIEKNLKDQQVYPIRFIGEFPSDVMKYKQ